MNTACLWITIVKYTKENLYSKNNMFLLFLKQALFEEFILQTIPCSKSLALFYILKFFFIVFLWT